MRFTRSAFKLTARSGRFRFPPACPALRACALRARRGILPGRASRKHPQQVAACPRCALFICLVNVAVAVPSAVPLPMPQQLQSETGQLNLINRASKIPTTSRIWFSLALSQLRCNCQSGRVPHKRRVFRHRIY